jgi:3-oxo-5-alpha-steroid 4-dehydrogenase 3 / polyprenol reductase
MHDATCSRWSTVQIAIWSVRAFYLLSSIIILAIRFLPALANRFLAYGARAQEPHNGSARQSMKNHQPLVGNTLLDRLAEITVPRSWFIHFYLLSGLLSACLNSAQSWLSFFGSSKMEGQKLGWAPYCCSLMAVHSFRRFLECCILDKPSNSRMWFGHYIMGIAFYTATNVAIWIECVEPAPKRLLSNTTQAERLLQLGQIISGTIFFAFASIKQNKYHRYLARLEKYTLPTRDAFAWIVAPHYTAECFIYLSLAFIGVPCPIRGGRVLDVNWTLLCTVLFTAVNLGVTADGTKKWQLCKFSDSTAEISKRWKMLPLVF